MPTPHNILKQIESHREQWHQVQQKLCAAMTMLLIKGYEFTPTRIDILFLDDTPIETKIQLVQHIRLHHGIKAYLPGNDQDAKRAIVEYNDDEWTL